MYSDVLEQLLLKALWGRITRTLIRARTSCADISQNVAFQRSKAATRANKDVSPTCYGNTSAFSSNQSFNRRDFASNSAVQNFVLNCPETPAPFVNSVKSVQLPDRCRVAVGFCLTAAVSSNAACFSAVLIAIGFFKCMFLMLARCR